jgi:hypothetical protein
MQNQRNIPDRSTSSKIPALRSSSAHIAEAKLLVRRASGEIAAIDIRCLRDLAGVLQYVIELLRSASKHCSQARLLLLREATRDLDLEREIRDDLEREIRDMVGVLAHGLSEIEQLERRTR